MDTSQDVPPEKAATARKLFQALTECGLSRDAMFRLLNDHYQNDTRPPHSGRPVILSHAKHCSVSTSSVMSTTSSGSTSRDSVISNRTSISSASSASYETSSMTATHKSSVGRSTSMSTRAYWCTSCETKFQRKFDWKRHEEEFHERYKKYPCNACNRVFYGSNTFNQHHKTAHGCQTCPHADKVIQYSRRKTAWSCGFCASLLHSRDRYYECVAKHYENGGTKAHWSHSNVIYGLLHQRPLHRPWKELWEAEYGHIPRDQRPVLEWDAETTGRAQGFLENESPGQLQDLLEFYDETVVDAGAMVRLALDLAKKTSRLGPSRPETDVVTATATAELMQPVYDIQLLTKSPPAISSPKHFTSPYSQPNPFFTPLTHQLHTVPSQDHIKTEYAEPSTVNLGLTHGAACLGSPSYPPSIAEVAEPESAHHGAPTQTFANLDSAYVEWTSLSTHPVADDSYSNLASMSAMNWQPHPGVHYTSPTGEHRG